MAQRRRATPKAVANRRPPRPLAPIPLTDIDKAVGRVAYYAYLFERRWTLDQLREIDPPLAERFDFATSAWHAALASGDVHAIEEMAASIIRGWLVVMRRMDESKTSGRIDGFLTSLPQAVIAALEEFPGARIVRIGRETLHDKYLEFYEPAPPYIGDPGASYYVGSVVEPDGYQGPRGKDYVAPDEPAAATADPGAAYLPGDPFLEPAAEEDDDGE